MSSYFSMFATAAQVQVERIKSRTDCNVSVIELREKKSLAAPLPLVFLLFFYSMEGGALRCSASPRFPTFRGRWCSVIFHPGRNSRGFGKIPEQGKVPAAKLFQKHQLQRWEPTGNGWGTAGEGGKAAEFVEKHQVWNGTAFPRLNKRLGIAK